MTSETPLEPTGYHISVKIPDVEEVTKGGIIRPDVVRDNERILTVFAEVVKLGPLAYKRGDMTSGKWCKPGDTILISKYAGARIQVDGVEHRVINDDEVQAVINDPSRVRRI